MRRVLKQETAHPARQNSLQQQSTFDAFVETFNNERAHEPLDMKTPAEVYAPSPRSYTGLLGVTYPLHDKTMHVMSYGRIILCRKKISISTA